MTAPTDRGATVNATKCGRTEMKVDKFKKFSSDGCGLIILCAAFGNIRTSLDDVWVCFLANESQVLRIITDTSIPVLGSFGDDCVFVVVLLITRH